MKNKILILIGLIVSLSGYAQVTVTNNTPFNGAFLGWNGAQDLDLRTNNLTHMRMMQNGNSTINGSVIDRSGFVALSQNPAVFGLPGASAFSLLHLNGDNGVGGGPQQLGYRSWMRHGITFTHNADLMYIGPKQTGNLDVTDAVIAWADNLAGAGNGPDNLVFMFTSGGPGGTDLELGRMTPAGLTGIGNTWSNTSQPRRTLDVVQEQNLPQFRLTRTRGTTATNGIHADFQVGNTGFLHILPRNAGNKRPVVVGFLPGGPEAVVLQSTTLDIGGVTRVRDLDALQTPRTLITGYQFADVNEGAGDHFLGRLDFSGNENTFLNGNAEWSSLTSEDCRWTNMNSVTIPGETDMHTGFDPTADCYKGKVGIGTNPARTKLHVESRFNLDGSPTAFYSKMVASQADEPDEYARLIGVQGIGDTESLSD